MTTIRPTQFYLIVNRFGEIVDFRDFSWNPRDVSPYIVLHWTGTVFVEWQKNDF